VRSGEIKGEIKALTGLRIVAAVWVVLFHFRPMLSDISPDFRENLAPVLNCGAQGVDLFFILSGFVLAWNYLDRMGRSWSARATLHFRGCGWPGCTRCTWSPCTWPHCW
jgi:peptidoglycan/LPS O-acetylase OafA/YrhL